jgi:hypothetical protein
MILVDTFVRHADPRLKTLLVQELVTLHPFVLGELVLRQLA